MLCLCVHVCECVVVYLANYRVLFAWHFFLRFFVNFCSIVFASFPGWWSDSDVYGQRAAAFVRDGDSSNDTWWHLVFGTYARREV